MKINFTEINFVLLILLNKRAKIVSRMVFYNMPVALTSVKKTSVLKTPIRQVT